MKKAIFHKAGFLWSGENPEHYVTPMVSAIKFVTKRYIVKVGTTKSANLALRNC